jgi:hypothetical protein
LTVLIDVEGLAEFKRTFEIAPEIANKAARIAINQTAERKGLKLARDAMLAQIAFPTGYLNETAKSGQKRFRLSYKATDTRLEAGIQATQSPTPLARFSRDRAVFARGGGRRAGGVRVTIKPGQSTTIKRAFLLNLRSGNIGLGIRLKNGETLTNTVGAKLITSGPLAGVALLYGPSVDQVFRTVAVDISPALLQELSVEFLRQFERLFRDANLSSA